MPIVNNQQRLDSVRKYAFDKKNTIYLEWDEDGSTYELDALYIYDKPKKSLYINCHKLSKESKCLILEIIKYIHDNGGLLWKESKKETLTNYTAFLKKNSDKETLDFFSTILSERDLSALKLSLFIRSEAQAGRNIREYKEDIKNRFGERGTVIANLCSANYFENEFIPLYLQMLRGEFIDYFEKVVSEKIRALFVHSGMSVKNIIDEIERMVSKGIKYHMDDFKIHGIGATNLTNINECVAELIEQGSDKYFIKRTYINNKLPAIEYTVFLVPKK